MLPFQFLHLSSFSPFQPEISLQRGDTAAFVSLHFSDHSPQPKVPNERPNLPHFGRKGAIKMESIRFKTKQTAGW